MLWVSCGYTVDNSLCGRLVSMLWITHCEYTVDKLWKNGLFWSQNQVKSPWLGPFFNHFQTIWQSFFRFFTVGGIRWVWIRKVMPKYSQHVLQVSSGFCLFLSIFSRCLHCDCHCGLHCVRVSLYVTVCVSVTPCITLTRSCYSKVFAIVLIIYSLQQGICHSRCCHCICIICYSKVFAISSTAEYLYAWHHIFTGRQHMPSSSQHWG